MIEGRRLPRNEMRDETQLLRVFQRQKLNIQPLVTVKCANIEIVQSRVI